MKRESEYRLWQEENREAEKIREEEKEQGRIQERDDDEESVDGAEGYWFSANTPPQPKCLIQLSRNLKPITLGGAHHIYRPTNAAETIFRVIYRDKKGFIKDFCAEAFSVERCNVPRLPFLDLEQMLSAVFTCQFVFGSGLSKTNVRDQFIHLDFTLAHSLIGDNILDRSTANIRALETPRLISVGYGFGDRVTVFEIASCQLRGKGIYPADISFDAYVVDTRKKVNAGYDRNRLMMGRDALERYLVSMTGDHTNGNVYFEDRKGFDYYTYFKTKQV